MLTLLWLLTRALAHEELHENKPGFVFLKEELVVPLNITVALVGFRGNGQRGAYLAEDQLQSILENSLQALVPSCVETRETTEVEFTLEYKVVQLNPEPLEDAVRRLMYPVDSISSKHGRAAHSRQGQPEQDEALGAKYEVDTMQFEQYLPDISVLRKHVSGESGRSAQPGSQSSLPPLSASYVVFVLNLDIDRIRPKDLPAGTAFSYQYRTGQGAPSQTWVGGGRFVVADLSAGPCEYGTQDSGEGAVAADTLPSPTRDLQEQTERLQQEMKQRADSEEERPTDLSAKFMATLSSLVVSAISHVFVSDLRFAELPQVDKIIVPLIVLRNHESWDPLSFRHQTPNTQQHGHQASEHGQATGLDRHDLEEFRIDLAAIRHEINRLLLPHQSLALVGRTHLLYQHPHLATALFKALKSDTAHAATPEGRLERKQVTFIDSEKLLLEIAAGADPLVQDMLGPSAAAGLPDLLEIAKEPVGTRVLPIFVFSLEGLWPELLLDKQHLMAVNSKLGLVLQTPYNNIPLPYFSEDGSVVANARPSTSRVIAAATTLIGGITYPYENWNGQRYQAEYMWATGRHPFGPFTGWSSGLGMSQIMADLVQRQGVLSSILGAKKLVNEAVRRVETFNQNYVLSPLRASNLVAGADLARLFRSLGGDSVDGLFEPMPGTPEALKLMPQQLRLNDSPLPFQTVRRLLKEVLTIEDRFRAVSALISQHKLAKAYVEAASVLTVARGLAMYIEAEIVRSCRIISTTLDIQFISAQFSRQSRLAFLAKAENCSPTFGCCRCSRNVASSCPCVWRDV
eukprot:g11407.t1